MNWKIFWATEFKENMIGQFSYTTYTIALIAILVEKVMSLFKLMGFISTKFN